MKISVIITTYNRPDALERVLLALNSQSPLPHEIIIADDGSADATRNCIEGLREKMSVSLTHVWQPDQGFRAAKIRNKAIRACQGDYLILLDGDCIPDRHFIQDHRRLAKNGYFVQGKRILVDLAEATHFTHHSIVGRRFYYLFSRHLANRHHLVRMAWLPPLRTKRLGGIRSCNMGIFKADMYAVNGFNEDFEGWGREDSELAVRLYKYGLQRREHPFAAICFHLWHCEHHRGHLTFNDRLLQQALASDSYVCANGLVKNGGSADPTARHGQ